LSSVWREGLSTDRDWLRLPTAVRKTKVPQNHQHFVVAARLAFNAAFITCVVLVLTALVVVPRVGSRKPTAEATYSIELRGRPTYYVSRGYKLITTFGLPVGVALFAVGVTLRAIGKGGLGGPKDE
jgi:hypothetical protein